MKDTVSINSVECPHCGKIIPLEETDYSTSDAHNMLLGICKSCGKEHTLLITVTCMAFPV